MSEKNVYVSIPTSLAVDAVQLRLQTIASELELLGQSAKAPTFAALESVYSELFTLGYVLKTVEQEGKEGAQ